MAQAVGLGAAIDYLMSIGMHEVHSHEVALTKYLIDKLQQISDLKIVGQQVLILVVQLFHLLWGRFIHTIWASMLIVKVWQYAQDITVLGR